MSATAGILLAAGESRRMGGTNKLGLPSEGEPLLYRTARILNDHTVIDLDYPEDYVRVRERLERIAAIP